MTMANKQHAGPATNFAKLGIVVDGLKAEIKRLSKAQKPEAATNDELNEVIDGLIVLLFEARGYLRMYDRMIEPLTVAPLLTGISAAISEHHTNE